MINPQYLPFSPAEFLWKLGLAGSTLKTTSGSYNNLLLTTYSEKSVLKENSNTLYLFNTRLFKDGEKRILTEHSPGLKTMPGALAASPCPPPVTTSVALRQPLPSHPGVPRCQILYIFLVLCLLTYIFIFNSWSYIYPSGHLGYFI